MNIEYWVFVWGDGPEKSAENHQKMGLKVAFMTPFTRLNSHWESTLFVMIERPHIDDNSTIDRIYLNIKGLVFLYVRFVNNTALVHGRVHGSRRRYRPAEFIQNGYSIQVWTCPLSWFRHQSYGIYAWYWWRIDLAVSKAETRAVNRYIPTTWFVDPVFYRNRPIHGNMNAMNGRVHT